MTLIPPFPRRRESGQGMAGGMELLFVMGSLGKSEGLGKGNMQECHVGCNYSAEQLSMLMGWH